MASALDDYSDFDIQRKNAAAAEAANLQTQKNAIARRAAQMGGGPQGVTLKQDQLATDASAKRLGAANEDINAAQKAEARKNALVKEQENYQTSERESGQNFASGEAEKGRTFTSGEAEKGRLFSTSERVAGQGFASGENKRARDLQAKQFNKQYDLSKEQFKHEKEVDAFNKSMADRVQSGNEKQGFFDKVMDNPGQLVGMAVGGPAGAAVGAKLGGGGGGSIICTEYFRTGWISEEVYKGDQEYGTVYTDRDTKANYLAWSQYIAPLIRNHKLIRYALWPFFYNWVYYMAWKTGHSERKPFLGYIIVERISRPLTNLIGPFIRNRRKGTTSWA